MTRTGTRTEAGASSRSIHMSGTITAWTNNEPTSASASTVRSARMVRFPTNLSFDCWARGIYR